jgi:hypothetical protein
MRFFSLNSAKLKQSGWLPGFLLSILLAGESKGATGYTFTTLAGQAGSYSTNDGVGGAARFEGPNGVAVDSSGNVYVADRGDQAIRKVTPAGVVTTLAGHLLTTGTNDGTGSAARFNYPSALAVDGATNIFVADSGNYTIRKLTPVGTNWVVTTLAGKPGVSGSSDGTNAGARFSFALGNGTDGLAVDNADNIYVADEGNQTIRRVIPVGTNWVVTTIAGQPGNGGSSDGTNNNALFFYPLGVAVDSATNLYVVEQQNYTVRKITPVGTNWVVTTIAGQAGISGTNDGTNWAAEFYNPAGVAADAAGGNLFVADENNSTIRKVTRTGTNWVVTTVGGLADMPGTNDGTGTNARFNYPPSVALDNTGNVYVADAGNGTIRKGVLALPPVITSPPSSYVLNTGVSPVFTVTASGTLPLSYQWQFNGTNLADNSQYGGSQTSSLTISNATSSNTGTYKVIVTNAYGSTNASATLVVLTPPTITWGNPASITYGAALNSSQLNAAANVPGNFAYTPGAGAILHAGTNTLTATFTPTDTVDYNSATNSVSLVVSPAPLTVAAVNASRQFGQTNPVLTGTITGLVNGDNITASYSTTATTNSPQGTYPIIPTLVDPGNRLTNYTVNLVNGTLTVTPPAQIPVSENYIFTTLAGSARIGSADGVGTDAQFSGPASVAGDTAGNVYVADRGNNTIRKITPAGVVTTLAGFAGQPGSADGTGSGARFSYPSGVAVDGATNIYVVDMNNNTIRKITPAGVVTTIAGMAGVSGANDGTGTNARFYLNVPVGIPYNIAGIAVDSATNLYVADTHNYTIRKITPAGVVTTLAGQPGIYGTNDGTGSAARFNFPAGLAVDSGGNVYVADSFSDTIRKITPAGAVTTLAGKPEVYGSGDGTGSSALFNSPCGVVIDSTGNICVADSGNQTIRDVTPAGVVTTLAGLAGSEGATDGTGSTARFAIPLGVGRDGAGNIYVAEYENNTIRKITTAGLVTTLAGASTSQGSADGTGSTARFSNPFGMAVDASGNVYTADASGTTIRKASPAGVVTTLAGRAGSYGNVNGVGTDARFGYAIDVAVDKLGNVFVADRVNGSIRKVTPAGVVTTFAASFNGPYAVAVAGTGEVYVGDNVSSAIYQVTPAGAVSLLAGMPGTPGNADGTGTAARFNSPSGIAVDGAGNVYVADSVNQNIRMVTPAGVVTTLAGTFNVAGNADGIGSAATFDDPWGIAVDGATNLYVADSFNDTIRKLTPTGAVWVVSTIGGAPTPGGGPGMAGSADGAGSDARFNDPIGMAADPVGNLYIADAHNNTIRKGVVLPFASAIPGSVSQPVTNATLVVNLLPTNANGQWRFPWELAWRNSGTAVTNLVPNANYTIEFSPVPGYLATPAQVTTLITNGGTNFVIGQYYPTASSVDTNLGGSLQIFFQVNPPNGAGWRLLGSTNAFLGSGYTTNLLPGNYLIEFATLNNFARIPIQSVQITAGVPMVLQEIYQPSQTPPNGFLLPSPVPPGQISDETDYPYGFNGQLVTDVGYGSGVAVEPNVVLTAAHLVFNDQTLSYVSNAWWYPQEEAPQYVPEPQAAQGWLVLSGYASQRTNDLHSGFAADASSPQSRNFDVAVLYFQSPVAGGGYGGYLTSDATPNAWLASTANKMLAGYPVDDSMFQGSGVVAGQMYQVGPQPYQLTQATDPVNDQQVYAATWFLSYPGNSGGPFYVQYDGYYYPAGVYLGTLFSGTTPIASAIRAIDSNVVNLITNAQAFVSTGTNNGGGGVVTVNAGAGVSSGSSGTVVNTIFPLAAVQAGAGWAPSGNAAYTVGNPSAYTVTLSGQSQLVFKPITGWNLPSNQSVAVASGGTVYVTNYYTVAVNWPPPVPISYGTPLGAAQLNATIPAITNGTSGSYGYAPGTGTVLNTGAYPLSVTFTPGDVPDYGGPSATNTILVVTPGHLTVTAGNLTWYAGQPFPATFTGAISGLVNNDNITATYACSATSNSPPGAYLIVPSLVDPNNRLTNYTYSLVNGTLTIAGTGQLVQNGGFETGDFTGWTLTGNAITASNDNGDPTSIDIYVDRTYAHSGNHGADLEPYLTLGYLSQNLPTSAGQMYLLSLWLDSSANNEIPNEFSVAWNGATLFDKTNLGATGWTNLKYGVAATTTNTLLKIGFRDDVYSLGLDDVSVVPLVSPVLQNALLTPTNISLTWNAISNETYQVQACSNLAQPNWNAVGGIISATNNTAGTNVPIGTNAGQLFYRVVLMP